MVRKWKLACVATAAAGMFGLASRPAHAAYSPMQHGLGVEAGGGVTDFAQGSARNLTQAGGDWNGRLVLGTNSLIAAEGAYQGSAQGFKGIDGQLIGSNVGGDLRLNLGTYRIQPFVLGGAGYQWYRVANTAPNSQVASSGQVLRTGSEVMVPVGGGIDAYLGKSRHFNVDARFTYGLATKSNIIGTNTGRADQWFANANLGYVF